MILRTSGIGVSIAFLREAQWGSRGREFDSRHSDHKSNDFTLEIVGFFCLWADLIWFWPQFGPQCQRFYLVYCLCRMPAVSGAEKPFCSAKSSVSCSTVMPVYTLQEDRQILAADAEDASAGRLGILFCRLTCQCGHDQRGRVKISHIVLKNDCRTIPALLWTDIEWSTTYKSWCQELRFCDTKKRHPRFW